MKERWRILLTCLTSLIILTAVGAAIANSTIVLSAEEVQAIEEERRKNEFDVPYQTFPHGQDSVICWEDPGMEAYVRFLLRKPEGDILCSEIWDVQVFVIDLRFAQNRHCVFLTELPEEWDSFSEEYIERDPNVCRYFGGAEFPTVCSLGDLRHFSSLQVFMLQDAPNTTQPLNVTGAELCENLQVLRVENRLLTD